MRRRLTLAILGTVLATLVVAGFGTLVLARIGARRQTEHDLRAQVESSATLLRLRQETSVQGGTLLPREQLARLRKLLSLADFNLVVLTPDNEVSGQVGDPLPAGVTLAELDPAALRAGDIVSGNAGRGVFAAAPLTPERNYLAVLVMTRPVEPILGTAVGWFILASAITLLLAAVIAWRLARQLTKPLRDANAATARIAAGDLSTRLEVPTPPRRRPDELDALASSINQMAEALERSRGLERQFLLSVSHDLRTPLTSIRGYAEAIADGTAPDHGAAAAVILSESGRLERLVRDLLDLAKLESRQFSLHPVRTELAAVASQGLDGFRPQADAAGIALSLDTPAAPVVVTVDADRFIQVVANLTANALRYARSRVDVRVVRAGGWGRLEVADDGPGIAPEDLPHVFERLYVAKHQPVRNEIGSGLGLAIVRELIEAMGGTVHAEPNPAGGTTLVVMVVADQSTSGSATTLADA